MTFQENKANFKVFSENMTRTERDLFFLLKAL